MLLPLEFAAGTTSQTLGLTGEEVIDVEGLDGSALTPRGQVTACPGSDGFGGKRLAHVRIDTPVEMDYYRNGGILQTVLRKLLAGS
ncbi:MAG: hypothetical protein U0935_03000 [Pirellulales bacterium]